MKKKQILESRIRGWFPKEPLTCYVHNPVKSKFKKPVWIVFTLVTLIIVCFGAYIAAQTYIRYINPQADVTSSYFERRLNCTSASVGDFVEVTVLVNWHGRVFPEFKREVETIDFFPESNFQLADGHNSFNYSGYGGGYQFEYTLKVISCDRNNTSVGFPNTKLFLDNTEILLKSTNTNQLTNLTIVNIASN